MFLDSVGIILRKSHISQHKLIILDKIQGKIECVTTMPSLSTGALITYNIQRQHNTHFMSNSKLLYIPLSLAQTDMLFFHHVLELVYYFTHVGNCTQEIFDLLAFLYSAEATTITTQCKKFFLLKLLSSIGNVPELATAARNTIATFNAQSMLHLSTMTINKKDEQTLDIWLWSCVWQHPYVSEFKTVHFLTENRAI